MRTSLAFTIVGYALCVTVWLTIQSYKKIGRPVVSTAALGVLECALILLGTMDVVSIIRGDRPHELAVHLAYVGASVTVLPLVLTIANAGRKEPATIVAAVGSAAVAVIVVRLQMTGAQ
jgi:hypothetical protein